MEELQQPQECSDPGGARASTLGDVLYSGQVAPTVPEAGWVELVHAVSAGRQAALHALYDRAHRMVFTIALRITGNRESAEEVTLDVFHDVWRRAAEYHPSNGTVLGWIMNQARSRALDRFRHDHRKKRAAPDDGHVVEEEGRGLDPSDVLELKQRSQAVRGALGALAADERHALEAAFFLGLTHAEIAARLGAPLGTVKTRIRSGLHKLRKAMEGERA